MTTAQDHHAKYMTAGENRAVIFIMLTFLTQLVEKLVSTVTFGRCRVYWLYTCPATAYRAALSTCRAAPNIGGTKV